MNGEKRFLAAASLTLLALVFAGSPVISADSTAIEQQRFECVIEPEQTVKLASQAVGVIAKLNVDRGDFVEKGQVIGNLEDGVEQANLALARARALNEYTVKSSGARLEFLRRKSNRAAALRERSVVSEESADEFASEANVAEQQLKEAELNLQVSQLEVKQAEELVKQRLLRSPLTGVVVERLLMPGEYRNDQTPVLTLAQIDPLRVEVYVPTAYYGKVQLNAEAEVFPEAPVGGKYMAIVKVVDRVLDAASGTFGVRLALANKDRKLPAGLKCQIRFPAASSAAPAGAAGAKK